MLMAVVSIGDYNSSEGGALRSQLRAEPRNFNRSPRLTG